MILKTKNTALDTIHECDGRIDGHWPTAKTALMHSVLSKNVEILPFFKTKFW